MYCNHSSNQLLYVNTRSCYPSTVINTIWSNHWCVKGLMVSLWLPRLTWMYSMYQWKFFHVYEGFSGFSWTALSSPTAKYQFPFKALLIYFSMWRVKRFPLFNTWHSVWLSYTAELSHQCCSYYRSVSMFTGPQFCACTVCILQPAFSDCSEDAALGATLSSRFSLLFTPVTAMHVLVLACHLLRHDGTVSCGMLYLNLLLRRLHT